MKKYLLAAAALVAVWLSSCLPPLTLYYLVAIVGATTLSMWIMAVVEWLDTPKGGKAHG